MTAIETEERALTPTQIEGPYYKVGSPKRSTLIEPGITGTPLVLTGQVLNERGTPIPGAVLDFWQSDDVGNYDMLGDILRGAGDDRARLLRAAPGTPYPRQSAGRQPTVYDAAVFLG